MIVVQGDELKCRPVMGIVKTMILDIDWEFRHETFTTFNKRVTENLNSKFFENLKNPTVIFSNFENLTVKNSNSYFWDYIHI